LAQRRGQESLRAQGFAHQLAGLGTLSAVEFKYAQVPGCAVPTPSDLDPFHQRVFTLLGFQSQLTLHEPSAGSGSAAREAEACPRWSVRIAATARLGKRNRDFGKPIE